MFVTTKVGISFSTENLFAIHFKNNDRIEFARFGGGESQWITKEEWKSFYDELFPILEDFIFINENSILNIKNMRSMKYTSGKLYLVFCPGDNHYIDCTSEEYEKMLSRVQKYYKNKQNDSNKLSDILEMLVFMPGGPMAKSLEEDFKSKIVH
jgi:hypothetical protein